MSDRELEQALGIAAGVKSALIHPDALVIIAAARRQLALALEKCGECDGSGEYETGLGPYDGPSLKDCPVCHGKGFLYPPALVAVVEQVLDGHVLIGRYEAIEDLAAAVLDALNQFPAPEEVGK